MRGLPDTGNDTTVDNYIWAPVVVALINMVGSVLLMWIRARHRWKNGVDEGRRESQEKGETK